MLPRRALLIATLATPAASWAQQRRSLSDPLRLGVDPALMESGLARALQRAFGGDTGVVVQLVPGPATATLEALERGELDAALTNAPAVEAPLEAQGLVHDRQPIARGEFVIVGPAGKGRDTAGIAGMRNAAQALLRIRDAALAAPRTVRFMSAGDGSGTHLAEQALWRAAQVAPAAPWYLTAKVQGELFAQAREQSAYALVERGAWGARGAAPLAVLVAGDPALVVAVHAMRSFRVNHPAGKMFVAWIAGPHGHRVAAGVRGYLAPAG